MIRNPILAAALLLVLAAGVASAQTLPPVQNVLHLSSTGEVEVQQDMLTIQLNATRDGADATAVQTQLKATLDAALAEARRAAQPIQMEVRTGNFALYPRHGRDGRISGWTGTAELILEGRDFPRITQTAGRIPGMTMAGVSFGLSKEQRASVEAQAQAKAIERFKARAAELARGFGFSGYSLREVTVNSGDQIHHPRPRMMAMESRAASAPDAPVPAEPGKSAVTVTVSGSVQLR